MTKRDLPRVDIALAKTLERAEATANGATVEARQAVRPEVGAEWIEVAGAYAMFDGPEAPTTQTFGIGLYDRFLDSEFETVEKFFERHQTTTFHEVCSFAAHETQGLLSARGYTPFEPSIVLLRSTANHAAAKPGAVTTRAIETDELPTWCRVAGEAWSNESPELGEFVANLRDIWARTRGITCFLAERDGEPIASGALNIANGVAIMAGASTIPSARRQGAQLALFDARLAFAAERGIKLAMVVTAPGGGSQRNSERLGFRPVYSRMKWKRAHVAGRFP
ncbi:MAG: GNAT family N-acetyltransferase [Gemmatimonadaceae bacterium]